MLLVTIMRAVIPNVGVSTSVGELPSTSCEGSGLSSKYIVDNMWIGCGRECKCQDLGTNTDHLVVTFDNQRFVAILNLLCGFDKK